MIEAVGILFALAVIAAGFVLSGIAILVWRKWLEGEAGRMFDVFRAIAAALWERLQQYRAARDKAKAKP